MTTRPFDHPVFCALDMTDMPGALDLARRLSGAVGGVKLGLEFFGANGPEGVRRVAGTGLPVFLDLKLHDIPNTVGRAVQALRSLRPAILTVHAAGGMAMMRAARDTAEAETLVVGVTVLTSLDRADLAATGAAGAVEDQVLRLAGLARDAGLDGVVCSPHEAARLRGAFGSDFLLIVPGIRPRGATPGDQKRVLGPAEALRAGADVLVVGRPITEAADPLAAARALAGEIVAVQS